MLEEAGEGNWAEEGACWMWGLGSCQGTPWPLNAACVAGEGGWLGVVEGRGC